MTDQEQAWLAGILEGEGCFTIYSNGRKKGPLIQLVMADEDIIATIAKMFGRNYRVRKQTAAHHSLLYQVDWRGQRALELMKLLYPRFYSRRRARIDELLREFS